MSPSLYELTGEIVSLDKLLAEIGGDVSEGTEGETLERWAAEFDWKMKAKVDSYGRLYRNIEADAAVIGEEIKRLQDRKRIMENRGARLKALAQDAMTRLGVRKLDGVTTTIAIQRAGGKDPVEILQEDPAGLPKEYQRVTVEADKEKIREALKRDGGAPELDGLARIGQRREFVTIK